jgi:hypothetical protein
MKAKNVLFPLEMLLKLAGLLSYWDVSSYDYAIQCDYDEVINAVQDKLQAIELRETYAKIIKADDESRFYARLDYLRLRRDRSRTPPV